MADLKILRIDNKSMNNPIAKAGDFLRMIDDVIDIPLEYKSFNVSNISVQNNTLVYIPVNWVAEKDGVNIAFAYVNFSANATGERYISIRRKRDGEYFNIGSIMRLPSCQSGETLLSVTAINSVKEGDEFYIQVQQTSGVTLTLLNAWYIGIFIPKDNS